jgi:hypothetical protein
MRNATGHYALAICDRCGFRLKYLDLVLEAQTSLRVCDACLDEPQPERARRPDAIALRDPRPDPQEGAQ